MIVSIAMAKVEHCRRITSLLAAASLLSITGAVSFAADPHGLPDQLVKIAEATAALPALKAEMEKQVSEGNFLAASRTGRRICKVLGDGPDPNPAAYSYVAAEIVDYFVAAENLVAASEFASQLLEQLGQLEAPEELLQATRQNIQAIEKLQALAASPEPEQVRRYFAHLRAELRQRVTPAESNAPDVSGDQDDTAAALSPRSEMLALEREFFPENHLYIIQSLASIAAQQVQEDGLGEARAQLEALAQLDVPDFPALLKGHVGWLKALIAIAEDDLDAAAQAAWEAAEGYSEPWAVDGAAVLSMVGYELQNAELYADAVDLHQSAAEVYLRCGMLHDSLDDAVWLISSLRLAERWNETGDIIAKTRALATALSFDEYQGILWLESAWTAEAFGNLTEMKHAYSQAVAAYQRAGEFEDACNVLQYEADSFDAVVDNRSALDAYHRLFRLALNEQLHERAADAAVDVAGRVRRLSDFETQIKTLEGYRDQMRHPAAMRIILDEIARLKAGMGVEFAEARRRSREIAKRIAAGEDPEELTEELHAELDDMPKEADAKLEGEAFMQIAHDDFEHQRFGLAAENFFNAAQWFNHAEEMSERIRDAMQQRGQALLRSHQFEDAGAAYRIASSHEGADVYNQWRGRYGQALSLLAAQHAEEALTIATSLSEGKLGNQDAEDREHGELAYPERQGQLQAHWIRSDALWQRGDFAEAEQVSIDMLEQLSDWIAALRDHLPHAADADVVPTDRVRSSGRFRELQFDYLDTRDRLSLGKFDVDTMITQYPARTIVVEVREALFRDRRDGTRLLKQVAEQATAPDLQAAARQITGLLARPAYDTNLVREDDPAGMQHLLRARHLRRQRDFEPLYSVAIQAIDSQQAVAEGEQAWLLRMEAQLLACEALVRWPGGIPFDRKEDARAHLDQAEALLAATGNRPDDMARCGALRHLVESLHTIENLPLGTFATALDWLSDYSLAISPSRAPDPTLFVATSEIFLDQLLDGKYFARSDVMHALPISENVREVLYVLFTPEADRQNLSLIGAATEARPEGSHFITRAVCLATLDRVAGEHVGPYYQGAVTGAFGDELGYSLHADALRLLLRPDRQWLERMTDSQIHPAFALLWVEHADAENAAEPADAAALPMQPLVVRRIFDGRDSLFGIADDPQHWQPLLDWARRNLPGQENEQLLDQLALSIALHPKAEDENLQHVRFSLMGMERLRSAVAAALGLPLPKADRRSTTAVQWLQNIGRMLSR